MGSSTDLAVIEPYIVTVEDRNVKHELSETVETSTHPDHESQAIMFLTNVKYIFEDDEEPLHEQEEDAAIENVVVIEASENLEVKQVELISDEFKQLGFQVRDGSEVAIEALSQFEMPAAPEQLPLERLFQLYRTQNDQLHSLFNTL